MRFILDKIDKLSSLGGGGL